MIKSILDTDLYKFSVSYAYFNLYPLAEGTFTFTDRNREKWSKEDQDRIMGRFDDELKILSGMSLTEQEMSWCIGNIPYIPATYWEWLSTFRFDKYKSKMTYGFDDGVFFCSVTDKLYKATLYEIMVLATYSEIRNSIICECPDRAEIAETLSKKIETANRNGIHFSEFGTRRRFSSKYQETVMEGLYRSSRTCSGTSNVYYAMRYGMKPIGTFPHEWVMFHGACFGYKRANYLSLEDWIKTYRGDLGIALVDTYTTDSFLHTLTKQQAMLLSGFRQDSGDEFEVGDKIIARIRELGIDPATKTIVFSNALNFNKANRINERFKGLCKVSFGIGTNLTCDIQNPDFKPANIVMKLTKCRLSGKDEWEKCIKISDDAGKHMGDSQELNCARFELKLK